MNNMHPSTGSVPPSRDNEPRPITTYMIIGMIASAVVIVIALVVILLNITTEGPSKTPTTPVAKSVATPATKGTTAGAVVASPTAMQEAGVPTVTLTPTPTVRPTAAQGIITYTIQPNDTLGAIAERFNVTSKSIQALNGIVDPDFIHVGEVLTITLGAAEDSPRATVMATAVATQTAATTVTPRPALARQYAFAPLEGRFEPAYPLTADAGDTVIRYQQDSYVSDHLSTITAFVETARASISRMMGVTYTKPMNVYLSDRLFEPPDMALHGHSYADGYRVMALYNGSYALPEQNYTLAHEMTHLIAWYTYGTPSSAMVSEGLAVYMGSQLADRSILPIQSICLAYSRAGLLPSVSSSNLQFLGHLLYFDTYYASGCFVQYLAATYGMDSIAKVYHSGQYASVFGKNLAALEKEWQASLNADTTSLTPAVANLPATYSSLVAQYKAWLAAAANGTMDWPAYDQLEQQRIALLQGTGSSVMEISPCDQPPDDYARVEIGSDTVNSRTLTMLTTAARLYHGRGNPLNITQGSYTSATAESFGTHAGGGVVDISVLTKAKPVTVMAVAEIIAMVKALRQAGFAAWLRMPGDMNVPTALHVHAVAIGDRELSPQARLQLDGPGGYFSGFDGIPPEWGGPKPDRYGGPLVCDWMRRLGYANVP